MNFPTFEQLKDIMSGLSDLIKRAIATIKTFVESWKKPIDIITTAEAEVVTE